MDSAKVKPPPKQKQLEWGTLFLTDYWPLTTSH